MADDTSFGARVQDILTTGLNAAAEIAVAKFAVNDPTVNTSAPNGAPVKIGQGGTVAQGGQGASFLGGIPPMVLWVTLAGLVALLVVPRLLRSR